MVRTAVATTRAMAIDPSRKGGSPDTVDTLAAIAIRTVKPRDTGVTEATIMPIGDIATIAGTTTAIGMTGRAGKGCGEAFAGW